MRPADATSPSAVALPDGERARVEFVRSRGRRARATAALVGGRDEPLRYTTTAAQRASDYMPADLLSDSLLYIVSYMRRLLVEQQALEHVPCADCEQYTGHPRGVSRLGPRRPAAVRRGRPRRSRARRRICVADEVCVRTDSRCTRTPLRRGIGPRPEDRPAVPRGVHAVRTVG